MVTASTVLRIGKWSAYVSLALSIAEILIAAYACDTGGGNWCLMVAAAMGHATIGGFVVAECREQEARVAREVLRALQGHEVWNDEVLDAWKRQRDALQALGRGVRGKPGDPNSLVILESTSKGMNWWHASLLRHGKPASKPKK